MWDFFDAFVSVLTAALAIVITGASTFAAALTAYGFSGGSIPLSFLAALALVAFWAWFWSTL